MNLQEARAALGGRDARKVYNNTQLVALDCGGVGLILHSTRVITWHPGGAVTYDTGGYETVTTKARLCTYGPYPVWQERGEWFTVCPETGAAVAFGNDGAGRHHFPAERGAA